MKSRTLLVILLVVGIAGGLIWWMQRPPAADSANTATASNLGTPAPATTAPASKVEASKPSPVVVAPTSPNPETKIAAPTNPRGIVAPPASAMVAAPAASSNVTSIATDPGSSPAANSPGTTAVSTKGLRFAAGPDGGADKVMTFFQRTSASSPSTARILGDLSQLQLESPLAIYTLNPPDIVDGGGLETAKLASFLYVAEASGKPVIGEEMSSSTLHISSYFAYADVSASIEQLAANDQVKAGAFEARLLSTAEGAATRPVSVIWLKSESSDGTDLIYTLVQPSQGLKGNTLYSVDDYLKVYRKLVTPKTPKASTGG